jgi:membrane-associated phospholipid phosphatase
VTHKPGLRDLGWHGVESVIYAQALTGVLKGVLGRARPFVVNDSNPHDFKFFGGFSNSDRTSFPSGHTTTAFAAAASVTSEARRHWPDKWWSTWLIGPVLYGGATMVGISRMYHNKHWASDVVMGAAIGTVSGYKVVDYSHAHPDNLIDRVVLRTSAIPTPDGGVRVGFVLETP